MNKPSHEHISAFVDGELSRQEVDDMFAAMAGDNELASSACELRTLKLMVRHAYEDVLKEPAPSTPFWRRPLTSAIAAMLVLAIGSISGWKLHESTMSSQWKTASIFPQGVHPVSLSSVPSTDGIILHIDDNKPEQIHAALQEAAEILNNAQANGLKTRIEILANYYGLDMLRSDRSADARRIAQLAAEYPNKLQFVACSQSIKRFEREGQTVRLLPGVQVAPSAIGEIVGHLKAGWSYIKV
ncbi:MAG: hypothetical protein WCA45_09685 [Thiobacillaceae bacterium]